VNVSTEYSVHYLGSRPVAGAEHVALVVSSSRDREHVWQVVTDAPLPDECILGRLVSYGSLVTITDDDGSRTYHPVTRKRRKTITMRDAGVTFKTSVTLRHELD